MDYVKLGSTGLDVSRLRLGCMTFGVPDAGVHSRTLGEADSRPIIKRAVELGINFFDTANSYSAGTSKLFLCQKPRPSRLYSDKPSEVAIKIDNRGY